MKVKFFFFCLSFIIMGTGTGSAQYQYPFLNPDLPIETRVNDLVSRLTLEEKVAQMLNDAPAIEHLGIPAHNWWNECLHGIGRSDYKVTVFPQAIGMAASWDKETFRQVANAISDEGRAINNDALSKGDHSQYHGLTYWTPNINIFRDPRWGRGQETYGEDPYLTGIMGKEFVKGLQGENEKYLKAAACAKHYAVHSGPEWNRHYFNTEVSLYDLWDTYLPAFRDLVVDAKVAGVMCAYNAYGGQPCCGSDVLMTDILRGKWGFSGYVTSDCGAINDFYNHHRTHANAMVASADAIYHGTDIDCGNEAYFALVDAVNNGLLTEEQLDISLKRLFMIRFRLGLFDPAGQVEYAQIPVSVLECRAHKELALKIARESMVLLKNDNHLLPLSKKLKKIAVIGPNADNETMLLGNYNGFPSEMNTPLKAIQKKLKNTKITYEQGIDLVSNEDKTEEIDILIEKIKDHEVVLFFGGISPQLEGEEMPVNAPGFRGGDRTTIELPEVQRNFLKQLRDAGVPTVFVMMTGSAIGIEWEAVHVPAILNAWYGGQAGGDALADILFGDYNPSGKLPITFYQGDESLPPFGTYSMENRTYRYFDGTVTYPFGYGLSYTDFSYGNLRFPDQVEAGKEIEIQVDITNTGKTSGEEVAQLYLTHKDVQGFTPLYALKGFERISLKPGETKTVSFKLSPQQLAQVNPEGSLKVMPGKVNVYAGGCSPAKTTAKKLSFVNGEFSITGKSLSLNN